MFGASLYVHSATVYEETERPFRLDYRVWMLSAVYSGIIVFGRSALFTVGLSCLEAHFTSILSLFTKRPSAFYGRNIVLGGSAPFALGLSSLDAQRCLRWDYRVWRISAIYRRIIVFRGSLYVHSVGGSPKNLSAVYDGIIVFGRSAMFMIGLSCLEAHFTSILSVVLRRNRSLFTVGLSCLAAQCCLQTDYRVWRITLRPVCP